ncbi:MAG: protein kinase [Sandaracinus sp.]
MARSDDTNGSDRRHPDDAPARPTRVGRYLVRGTLAKGGMGEVLRARAIGAAGATKEVCVKRIRASRLGDRSAVERFVHEARLSLALTHANIVATFDFGRAEQDYYLAMEWIDGADLGRILQHAADAPLSVGAMAHVGAEVARALRHAHGDDGTTRDDGSPAIVHCDVKPSNILVSRSGDVKLADFGVAVARLEDHRGGTPRYTAPEVQSGGAVTAAADLYSLGGVLGDLASRARAPEAGSALDDIAKAIAALSESLRAPTPEARPTAAAVVSRLEELGARARVAGEDSPRDELGARATRATPTLERADATIDPDASYVRDGRSELETRLTATKPSASHPPPSGRARPPALVLAVASVAALAVLVGLASLGGTTRDEGWPPRSSLGSQHERAPVELATVTPPGAHTSSAQTSSGPIEPTGAQSQTGTQTETGTQTQTGTQTETGTQIGTGTRTQTGARTQTGTPAGTGRQAQTGARTETGSRTGAGTETGGSSGTASPGAHTGTGPPSAGETAEGSATTISAAQASEAGSSTGTESPPATSSSTGTDPAASSEPATLRINATPWANVEIDGRPVGPTPLVHVEVTPGPHTIVLTNPVLSRSRTTHIEVRAGERRDVIVEM